MSWLILNSLFETSKTFNVSRAIYEGVSSTFDVSREIREEVSQTFDVSRSIWGTITATLSISRDIRNQIENPFTVSRTILTYYGTKRPRYTVYYERAVKEFFHQNESVTSDYRKSRFK